jgi:acetylornithine/LysW-gamma-L-lysine aminotransferase
MSDRHGSEFASFPRHALEIVRGEGAHLWDSQGHRYLDLGASHGTANVGHANPEVVSAIRRQAGELIQLAGSFASPVRGEFLRRLVATLPSGLDRVFLSNSGTESVEAAIKFARSATGRPRIVAAMRGFHGRTMGALSATWRPEFRASFEPLVPEFAHVPFNDPAALEVAVDECTAAVLLEPVQGEGGIHPAAEGYLAHARAVTASHGALLILDEVQTGVGRTGRFWAMERWGVTPDIVTAAKSLAGGVPIGATITTDAVEAAFHGSHQSTFGGNPLACAAATATLAYCEREKIAARAEHLGQLARERLADLPDSIVREVRGLGLMIGIELRSRASPYLEALRNRGYLAISGGANVIRLLPPLVIDEEEWVEALDAVREIVARG